jgi:hypothetical protein
MDFSQSSAFVDVLYDYLGEAGPLLKKVNEAFSGEEGYSTLPRCSKHCFEEIVADCDLT